MKRVFDCSFQIYCITDNYFRIVVKCCQALQWTVIDIQSHVQLCCYQGIQTAALINYDSTAELICVVQRDSDSEFTTFIMGVREGGQHRFKFSGKVLSL